jgi:transcriptional regulator with XRE-family HTH domain
MNKAIGIALKALRKNNGLTQEGLAEYLNISQSAYSRIENGDSNSWSIHLEKLCKFYNVNPAIIFKNITIFSP